MEVKELKRVLKEDNEIYLYNDMTPKNARLSFKNGGWCIDYILPNGRVGKEKVYEDFKESLKELYVFNENEEIEGSIKELFDNFMFNTYQNFFFKKRNVILTYDYAEEVFRLCKEVDKYNHFFGKGDEWKWKKDDLKSAIDYMESV